MHHTKGKMGSRKNDPHLRMCCVCRQKKEKEALIRVVRKTDGTVVLDTGERLNGRGAYLCKTETCIVKAQKTGVLPRTLKVPVSEEVIKLLMEQKNDG